METIVRCSRKGIPLRKKPIAERFWPKVNKAPGQGPKGKCWLWNASLRGGYGSFSTTSGMKAAHRVAYELAKGPIPTSLEVCHDCDTPACVNPEHLFLGTHLENMCDRDQKGRLISANALKTQCKRGHAFTPENTVQNGASRECRRCKNDRQNAAKQLQRLQRLR